MTLKLERLTAANGIDHGQAHDALSDVRATIALARLIREKQPKLYDWLFQLRSKQRVMDQVRLLQPMVHISGRFSAERHYLGVVLPLAWHPRNRNALIVCDLAPGPSGAAGCWTPTLCVNACTPAVMSLPKVSCRCRSSWCISTAARWLRRLNVLRAEDRQRLQLDMALYQARALRLTDAQELWHDKLAGHLCRGRFCSRVTDPEQQLYDGFIGDRDRRLCEQVRTG